MKWWMWLIIEILVISWLFSACTSMFKEYKTVHPEYIQGSITDDGFFEPSDQISICTKNIQKCTKFRFSQDFDSEVTVRFYFYDSNEEIVDIVEMTRSSFDFDYDDMPDNAVGIRLVLSRAGGFSDADCFNYQWFESGLSVSTRKEWKWSNLLPWNWFGSSDDDDSSNWVDDMINKGPSHWVDDLGNSLPIYHEDYDLSFGWGRIDSLGFMDKTDHTAVCTRDLITCDSYSLTFNSGTDYLCIVYYYDEDDRMVYSESVKPGETRTVISVTMPNITEPKISAVGIRICLVKVNTDVFNPDPSANEISFLEAMKADECLSLDIYLESVAPAA